MGHFCHRDFESFGQVIISVIANVKPAVSTVVGEETPQGVCVVAIVVAGLHEVLIPRTNSCVRVVIAIDGGFHDGFFVGIGVGNEERPIIKDEVVNEVDIVAISISVWY